MVQRQVLHEVVGLEVPIDPPAVHPCSQLHELV